MRGWGILPLLALALTSQGARASGPAYSFIELATQTPGIAVAKTYQFELMTDRDDFSSAIVYFNLANGLRFGCGVFAGAMQGARTLDNQLMDVARVYRLPWWAVLADVQLPHVASYLLPAWITALGTSWKVVMMAELLAAADGTGAALGAARGQLDSTAAMAWVVAVLGLPLTTEYLLLEPFKRMAERWRSLDP